MAKNNKLNLLNGLNSNTAPSIREITMGLAQKDANTMIGNTSRRQIAAVEVTATYAETIAEMHRLNDLAFDQPVDGDGNIVSDYDSGILRIPLGHPNGPKVLGFIAAEIAAGRYLYSPNDSNARNNEYTMAIAPNIATWNGAPKAVNVVWELTQASPFPQPRVTFVNVQLWGGTTVVRQELGVFDGQHEAWLKTQAYLALRRLAEDKLNHGLSLNEDERNVMVSKKTGEFRQPTGPDGLYYLTYVPQHDLPHSLAYLPYVLGQRYERSQGNWHRYGLVIAGNTESAIEWAAAHGRKNPREVAMLRETWGEDAYTFQIERIAGRRRVTLAEAPNFVSSI